MPPRYRTWATCSSSCGFGWMEQYGTVLVTATVKTDPLRFRDHVLTYEECAERLRQGIHLAKRLRSSG